MIVSEDNSLIFIAGSARLGKTTIARSVSRATGYKHVSADSLKFRFENIENFRDRQLVRIAEYLSLLNASARSNTKMIVEGDDLLYLDKHNSNKSRSLITLDLLKFFCDFLGVPAFAITCHGDDVENRARLMTIHSIEKNDWVYKKNNGDIKKIEDFFYKFAKRQVEHAEKIEGALGKSGVKVIHVRSDTFDSDIDRAVEEISDFILS